MVSKTEFQKCRLTARKKLLQDSGTHVASRYFRAYAVHLYSVSNFYVELWIRMDFDQICWIEIADSANVAENYAGKVDLRDLF